MGSQLNTLRGNDLDRVYYLKNIKYSDKEFFYYKVNISVCTFQSISKLFHQRCKIKIEES